MPNESKPSEHMKLFLDFVTGALSRYKLYGEYINTEDKLTQDLLHKLELGNLNRNEKSKLATRLAENRRTRRFYKDRLEEIQPIADFFEDASNKKVLERLKHILGDVRKAEEYHKVRNYKPRVLRGANDEQAD